MKRIIPLLLAVIIASTFSTNASAKRKKKSAKKTEIVTNAGTTELKVSDLLSPTDMADFGVKAGNYSGITNLGGGYYAICDDKDKCDGFTLLQLSMDEKTGKITSVKQTSPKDYATRKAAGLGTYRDCEGIAYCKDRGTLFVSGEQDQRILEYQLDGVPTGKELNIPACFGLAHIRSNYGFEALSYNEVTKRFWTTTESTLKEDGDYASLQNKNVQNLLRIQSFDLQLQPTEQFLYQMDTPETELTQGTYLDGVPSLLALDDGRLLVMEREEGVPSSYLGASCHIKLYVVDPTKATSGKLLDKQLLYDFTTYLRLLRMDIANYEGMCLGPKLKDGRQTILLICDSQGQQGNSIFHLKDYLRVLILEK